MQRLALANNSHLCDAANCAAVAPCRGAPALAPVPPSDLSHPSFPSRHPQLFTCSALLRAGETLLLWMGGCTWCCDCNCWLQQEGYQRLLESRGCDAQLRPWLGGPATQPDLAPGSLPSAAAFLSCLQDKPGMKIGVIGLGGLVSLPCVCY